MNKIMYVFVTLILLQAQSVAHAISKQEIATFLPVNPVLLEAGAHDGRDTVEWAKLLPSGTIYAFEPIPRFFSLIQEKTKDLSNVHCYPYVLSNENGEAPLHISSNNAAASSLLKPDVNNNGHLVTYASVSFGPTITVPTITLDAWMAAHHIERIDGMWLDLQGFEKQVLEASPKALEKVTVIYTEVSYNPSYHGVTIFKDFCAWLEKRGFTLKLIQDVNQHEANALFIKE